MATLFRFALMLLTSAYGAIAACGSFPCEINGVALYKIPSQPVDSRVDDLLSRMTLEEKVAQVCCCSRCGVLSIFIGELDK